MTVYNKLVRDRIPEIISARGLTYDVQVLDQASYAAKLDEKLHEEFQEYATSGDIAELADLVEVVYAILALRGVSLEAFDQLRVEKKLARGGFDQRYLLVNVDD